MDFTSNLREMLWAKVGENKDYPNRKRMADALGIDPSQLNRFLDGERGLSVESLGRILDGLGARVVLPGDAGEPAHEVRFVSPRVDGAASDATPPDAKDYIAVPLVSLAAAAKSGRIDPADIHGWMLVWRRHESVRFRTDLVAASIAAGEDGLAPVLRAGDVVLIDRGEKSPDPAGKIMLVRDPDGACAVRRVATQSAADDLELVFYADSPRDTPPRVRRLRRDYAGDLGRAIAGRVVWAWSDMTRN